jgi:hypothetical protein
MKEILLAQAKAEYDRLFQDVIDIDLELGEVVSRQSRLMSKKMRIETEKSGLFQVIMSLGGTP